MFLADDCIVHSVDYPALRRYVMGASGSGLRAGHWFRGAVSCMDVRFSLVVTDGIALTLCVPSVRCSTLFD